VAREARRGRERGADDHHARRFEREGEARAGLGAALPELAPGLQGGPRLSAPLLVVDAPSLLFRAFYALPKTITDDGGQPVNALLGTANMLLREIERHEPRAVVLCFGPDAAAYRVELFPAYHEDRPPVPDELAPQFADCGSFFGAFGWVIAAHDELEADDLLGSFASAEAEAGGHTLIMTGDRDMFQCAGETATVLYVRTGGAQGAEVVDAAEVKKRYGVPPELVPDFIALRGDPSDGIPGARGIGEKTAADLLKRHGSLEAALAAAPRERPARVSGALLDGREQLPVFKRLATLQRIEVERPPDTPTDYAGGAEAARARGMNRLAERLEKAAT
jgi:DNA polymerase-1